MKHKVIKAEEHLDDRGTLCVFEHTEILGFVAKRTYYIYGVPEGKMRAGHGHEKLEQIFIPIAGEFTLKLSDGTNWEIITLRNRHEALYVPKEYWRELFDISPDAVILVLASEPYDPTDYIHDYQDFLARYGTI